MSILKVWVIKFVYRKSHGWNVKKEKPPPLDTFMHTPLFCGTPCILPYPRSLHISWLTQGKLLRWLKYFSSQQNCPLQQRSGPRYSQFYNIVNNQHNIYLFIQHLHITNYNTLHNVHKFCNLINTSKYLYICNRNSMFKNYLQRNTLQKKFEG